MLTRNGFSCPLHFLQVFSWFLELWHVFVPIFIASKENLSIKSLSFLVLFYISSFSVIISGYLATKSNPSISVKAEPIYLETNESISFYCTVCKSYVSKTSKHCGQCDRCVENFDHHCKWLNNCIGKSNYKLFIFLIISLDINILFLFAYEIISLININEPKRIILILDSIFNFLIIIFLNYLIFLHLYLKCKNLTTYEYIKIRRHKNTQKVSSYKETDDNQDNLPKINIKKQNRVRVHRSCITFIEKNPDFILQSASQEVILSLVSFEN
ncbi:hypothetical protein SteCoe_26339 [Stentor coeruleus]|uniref:Palmitoyltransferase n=1 Tax=Stentor coeruleus TaxID=5963 RepID=A0A1R2BDI6_9CILI|nr:hypothetical protein SteCoe_26339 [Stentor coeruleus]